MRRNDGRLVLLSPVDFIAWTEGVAEKLARLDGAIAESGGFTGKELWITGRVEPDARAHLEAAGWVVEEDKDALLTD